MLSITKARVDGIERDVTKNGEDRRVELCPRAVAILESHLTWRKTLQRLPLRYRKPYTARRDTPQ